MRFFGNRLWKPAAVTLAAMSLAVCGGGDKKPGGPTVPVEPTVSPTPVTPAPPPPLSVSCSRLPAAATKYSCRDDSPTFLTEVNDAIDTLKNERPEIFDGDNVLNVGEYVVGVIKVLDRKGICGDYDGEELGVTNTGDYNDQYDILTAQNRVRRYFVGTCYPSVVPISRAPMTPPPAGCALPSSREISCGDPESQFVGLMLDAIDKLLNDRPELFDFNDVTNQGWPRVTNPDAYYAALIQIFTEKGFCGRFDGEEIALKRTNDFSEQFDVNYQDKYIRKGPGIYRGSCYPAAF